ncbi:mitochondrial inner membrane protein Mitofilin [Mycotypha africana]|uniref:mitochondrial inner membrane protein Mitofilin n=1 Tax=Mycotypha africana TaxID=64632 RepID=UPI0023012354|nr:mitochondrial inner membrane protein Mitofilin [Mycotypha africana]KAI8975189.1 mitochondrial inner membrane protein Mitofilin [Mycotypha africana]
MLRATKLNSNGVIRLNLSTANHSQFVKTAIIKRCESTAATHAEQQVEKRKISLFKPIITLSLAAGTVYGAAAVCALNIPDFRPFFTTHVPGGAQTLDFIEGNIQQKKNTDKTWTQHAEDYADAAKTKIKDTTDDWVQHAKDMYSSLTSQQQPAAVDSNRKKLANNNIVAANQIVFDEKAPSSSSSTKTISVPPSPSPSPLGDTTTNASITPTNTVAMTKVTSDKPNQPALVNVSLEKPEPIIVKTFQSDSTVVRELAQIVTELANILNDAGLSGLGRTVIADAESKIEQLNQRIVHADKEQHSILQSLHDLNKQGDKLQGSLEKVYQDAQKMLEKTQSEAAATIVAREAQLKNQFEQTRVEMKETFVQQLANDLDTQKRKLEKAREEALKAQAQELQRRFVSQVKLLVEQERAGRLAQLDSVNQRFKALEAYAVQNAQHLDLSRQYHVMHVTLDTLSDLLFCNTRSTGSFVEELQALANNTKDDTLVQTVLSAISPETVKEGISSLSELSTRFEQVANEIRRVALVPEEDGGFGSHIISIAMSYLMFKKQGLVQGDDVESVLSRTDYYLKRNNLEYATRELNQLTGWPKRLAEDWIQSARRHLEVKQALEVAETQAVLLSLMEA